MMAVTNKTSTGRSGRTPPFIIIGLLLLMAVLAYNYWSLWNANADLSSELDVVRIQKKDGDLIVVESEKKLASIRGNLIEAHENLNKEKKQVQAKEAELASAKSEVSNKQAEIDKIKTEKGQCDTNAANIKTELDALKVEKETFQKQLEEVKGKPADCNMASCKAPIKTILTVMAKFVTLDTMSKGLTEAKLDAASFLEGIQFPAQPPAKNTESGKGNQAESKDGENKRGDIETMKVDDRNITQLDSNKNISEDMKFKSDKDKNENKISEHSANLNDEKEDERVTKKANSRNLDEAEPTKMRNTNKVEIDNEEEDSKAKDNPGADEQNDKRKTVK